MNEDEKQQYAFEVSIGEYLMSKAEDGKVDISIVDEPLIRHFFNRGWGWSKVIFVTEDDDA